MRHFWLLTIFAVSLAACGGNDKNSDQAVGTVTLPSCSLGSAATDGTDSSGGLTAFTMVDKNKPNTRFIVKLRDSREAGAAIAARVASAASYGTGVGVISEPLAEGTVLIQTASPETAAALADRLASEDIEYIEPDEEVHYALALNDPKMESQWAHNMVNSRQAWDISTGNSSVVVAVIDSGIDYTHQDLGGNMWTNPREAAGNGVDDDGNGYVDDVYGWDFANDDSRPMADDSSSYHGTHVAGTIGAVGNNGIGISGHAPNVRLMALKFLNSGGSGLRSNAIKAIDYAVHNGAKILSNSWGGGTYSQALYEAIGRAKSAGVLFVAAAGNSGKDNDASEFYPANYAHDNVISVASSTSTDKLSSFSNYGRTKVDIAAPGSSIYSTKNGNSYQTLSGTSMATPLVSGVLATMIALRPDLNYKQVKGALFTSGVDVSSTFTGKVLTNGRINAYKAVAAIAGLPASQIPELDCP